MEFNFNYLSFVVLLLLLYEFLCKIKILNILLLLKICILYNIYKNDKIITLCTRFFDKLLLFIWKVKLKKEIVLQNIIYYSNIIS